MLTSKGRRLVAPSDGAHFIKGTTIKEIASVRFS
jgi:hypothetical protein